MAGKVVKLEDGERGYVYQRTGTDYTSGDCELTGWVITQGKDEYLVISQRSRFAGYYEAVKLLPDGGQSGLVNLHATVEQRQSARPFKATQRTS